MTFEGFGAATIRFLRALAENNDKTWFDGHRQDYEACYVAPAIRFVTAVQAPLKALDPDLAAAPRINGSVFRINRDVRFSKDKTPYKPHIDLWFWVGERKSPVSAMFLRLAPTTLFLGTGVHGFDAPRLGRFREAVVDPRSGPALEKATASVEAAGHQVLGARYKALPRGLDAPTPAAERFLRYNGLYGCSEGPHPASLGSAAFVDSCLEIWRACLPIHRWLVDLG